VGARETEVDGCIKPHRPYIVASHKDWLTGYVFRPRCGSWACPYCADLNRDEYAWRAIWGARHLSPHLPPLQFVTVTHRGYVSNAKAIIIFRLSWPKLIRRITYAQDQKPEYMLVPEHHKSGKMHAHFIITAVPHSQHWYHDQAFFSGLGYMARVKEVESPEKAGWYIHKELTKQLEGKKWPKEFRRVRLSRGWPLPEKHEYADQWEFEVCRDEGQKNWQVALLRDLGYAIHDPPA